MRISDWSSDVCSSDLMLEHYAVIARWNDLADALVARYGGLAERLVMYLAEDSIRADRSTLPRDRKSVVSGKRVSVRVDLGGRRIIKTKINITTEHMRHADIPVTSQIQKNITPK